MKRLLSIPLRVLLPVLLLSSAAIAGLISWELNTRLLVGEIESQFLDEARLRINSVQATLEYHFRKGDTNGVNLMVSGLATRNDVAAAFVLDGQDRIVAATTAATIGNAAEAIALALPEDLQGAHATQIAQVRASTHGNMVFSRDRSIAVAYYPLLVDVDEHALRSVRNGLMVLVLDTQIAKARALRAAGRQARDNALVFGGLAACAWVFIHLSLTRRVAGLVATTRRLASGDLTARTGIVGNDELANVARAFDAMADQIAEDILRRRQVEAELRWKTAVHEAQVNSSLDGILVVDDRGKKILQNGRFGALWKIPAELLDQDDDAATLRHVVSATVNPERFAERVAYLYAHPGETARDEIECKDGTVVDRYSSPVLGKDGKYYGRIWMFRDVTEQKHLNKQLVDVSRQAGMAEVASNVLHNVGNVLNSVNTSISIATDKVTRLKVAGLGRVAALLNEHAESLPAFFAGHAQGIRLPRFLTQLAAHFGTDQQSVLHELDSLRENFEHINEIVAMQQSYAGAGGIVEVLPLPGVIDDALRMNEGAFLRHGTRVIREFDPALPSMPIDRNKLLLILVNLVRNAKYACDECGTDDKCITVRAQLNGHGCVKISVSDNGVGIPTENLTRIFNHGFSTRKTGHGFGLHSSALAASEMGGVLRVQSGGPGQGATFTIELPLSPTP